MSPKLSCYLSPNMFKNLDARELCIVSDEDLRTKLRNDYQNEKVYRLELDRQEEIWREKSVRNSKDKALRKESTTISEPEVVAELRYQVNRLNRSIEQIQFERTMRTFPDMVLASMLAIIGLMVALVGQRMPRWKRRKAPCWLCSHRSSYRVHNSRTFFQYCSCGV